MRVKQTHEERIMRSLCLILLVVPRGSQHQSSYSSLKKRPLMLSSSHGIRRNEYAKTHISACLKSAWDPVAIASVTFAATVAVASSHRLIASDLMKTGGARFNLHVWRSFRRCRDDDKRGCAEGVRRWRVPLLHGCFRGCEKY